MKISKRAASLQPSVTLAISGKAKQMKAAGQDVLSLSAGEPDFKTPSRICEAAVEAMNQGHIGYTMVRGIPQLREAICTKFKNDNGLDYAPDEIVVSCGAKHSLYLALQAMIDPGDEVLVPAPYWVSYPPMVELAGGDAVIVETKPEEQFLLSAAQLEAAITPKTRALMLNSPSNPTGMVYTKERLLELAEVLRRHPDVAVICDDIYEKLVFDDTVFYSLPALAPDLKDRCVLVNGVSKTYAMTGWRLGYAAAPAPFAKMMDTLQGQMTSNATTFVQWASVEAIGGTQDELKSWVQTYQTRRDLMLSKLAQIPGVKAGKPQGAFYILADFRNWLGKSNGSKVMESDLDLAAWLLEDLLVACVPGEAFGAPGFLRFSYATSNEVIEKAMDRIAQAASRLS